VTDKVQRRFRPAKMIPAVENSPYEKRLAKLHLWTLARCITADVIKVHKIILDY